MEQLTVGREVGLFPFGQIRRSMDNGMCVALHKRESPELRIDLRAGSVKFHAVYSETETVAGKRPWDWTG